MYTAGVLRYSGANPAYAAIMRPTANSTSAKPAEMAMRRKGLSNSSLNTAYIQIGHAV
jgi:hypothetical protein